MKTPILFPLLSVLIWIVACSSPQKEAIKHKAKILKIEEISHVDSNENSTKIQEKSILNDFVKFSEFEKNAEVKPQFFLINNDQSHIIIGNQGTKIIVPKSAFVDSLGNEIEDQKSIVFQLKEFYSNKDIILNNLNTMSNGRVLETGGMINVAAYNNSTKLFLAKGKVLKISFPNNDTIAKNMSTFYGDSTEKGINWVLANNNIEKESSGFCRSRFTFRQTSKIVKTEKYKKVNIIRPKILNGKSILLSQLSYPKDTRRKRKSGHVKVKVWLNDLGVLYKTEILQHFTPQADSMVLNAISKLKTWSPTVINNIRSENKFFILVDFRVLKNGNTQITPLSFCEMNDELAFNKYRDSLLTFMNKAEHLKSLTVYKYEGWYYVGGKYIDSISYQKYKMDSLSMAKNQNSDQKVEVSNASNIGTYVLESANLGWINCDRFLKQATKDILVTGLNPKIILTNYKSVISSISIENGENGVSVFRVPKNESFVLLDFIKYKDGCLGVSYQKNNTSSAENFIASDYNKLSHKELNKLMENIRL